MNGTRIRMGNLFSKTPGNSSVKPSEKLPKIGGKNKPKMSGGKSTHSKKILVNDTPHEDLKLLNVAQTSNQSGGESDSDTVSLGMSTISKFSVKTPPPGDLARSRASIRAPTPLRSMDIDEESQELHKELQQMMKGQGYMDRFPTMHLLQEAKKLYRKTSADWPEDDEGVVCPCPPKRNKREIFDNERMLELDRHVCSLPHDFLHQPLFDLVKYLVDEAVTELEEAYVLYKWLTTLPMDSVVTQNGKSSVPQDYTIVFLQRLKRMSLCYADVLTEMVRYTTIEYVKITGQLRVYPKDPCESVTKQQSHTWVALFLDREWWLIDCFLGAKVWHDSQKQREQEKLLDIRPESSSLTNLHNFYFITDPEDLIFTHFPDREYWQLLPRWVNKSEFQSMPYLKPEFFSLGLESSVNKLSVQTQNGLCTLDVNFPQDAGMKFSCRLRLVSKKGNSVNKASLNNFVFLETSQKRQKATFLVTLPDKGKYVLELFGKCGNRFMLRQAHLCSFGIVCGQGLQGFKGYPDNDRSEWGPGIDADAVGLEPLSHESGIVETIDGEAEIVFKAPEHLSFFQKIVSSGGGKDEQYCAVHRTEKQKVVFTARPKVPGDSCLKILVRDEAKDGQLVGVCNYLLRCSQPNESVFSLPKIPNGRIGSRKELKKFGLRVISPKSSMVYSPESGRVDVNVQSTKAVTLKPTLTHYLGGQSADVSEYIVQTDDKNVHTFTLKLPKHGVYNFALYGKRSDDKKLSEHDDDKEGMTLLHNTLIFCHWAYKDCSEFPNTLSSWSKGCRLLCPQKKYLPAGSFLKFRVVVPEAEDVAVLDGEDWQHLQKEEGGLWEGDIMVDEDQAGSPIMVKASFKGEYKPLLQYHILSPIDYNALKDQRKNNCKKAKERVKKLKESKRWRDPPFQIDVCNTVDEDNVSLIVVDEDSEDGKTESEAGSKVTIRSSASTLKVGEVNGNTVIQDKSSDASSPSPEVQGKGSQSSENPGKTKETITTTGKAKEKTKPKNNGEQKSGPKEKSGSKAKDGEQNTSKTKDAGVQVETNDIMKKETQTKEHLANGRNKSSSNDQAGKKAKQDSSTKQNNKMEKGPSKPNGTLSPDERGSHTGIVSPGASTDSDEAHRFEGSPDAGVDGRGDADAKAKAEPGRTNEETTKKEVSFALDDESLRTSDSESESEDEGSEFETWQRKVKNEKQREEERTILDFSLPVRLLLKRLSGATKRRDKEELKTAMFDYQQKGLDTAKLDFQQARRMLSVLNLRDDITECIETNDIKRLRIRVHDAERRGFTYEMMHEMALARARLKTVEHVQRLHVQMTNTIIDIPTLSEIIRYVKPPVLVHHVVMAMLLLMKHHEGKTRRWRKSHKRCVMIGTLKLYHDVHHVNIGEIDPGVAARARQIVEMYAPDEAGMVSPGVGALYAWVQRVSETVLSHHDNGDEPIKPANVARQRKLFRNKKDKPSDPYHDRIKSTSMAAVRLRYNDLVSKDKKSKSTIGNK